MRVPRSKRNSVVCLHLVDDVFVARDVYSCLFLAGPLLISALVSALVSPVLLLASPSALWVTRAYAARHNNLGCLSA